MKKINHGKTLAKHEADPFSKENIKKAYVARRLTPDRIADVIMTSLDEIDDPKDRAYLALAAGKVMLPHAVEAPVQKTETQITIGFDPSLFPNMTNPSIIDVTPERLE